MVVDLPAAQNGETAASDAAKQLQQPTITWSVNAGRPDDHDFDTGPCAALTRDTLTFELGDLIDVSRPQRRVLGGGWMLDIPVHTTVLQCTTRRTPFPAAASMSSRTAMTFTAR